ncbi:FtsX-like permease family protein [Pseudoalteromonas prydzensis]|uniref:FtsX-like permease family protein n=1 Tax=Pseudoalteromonas prydzensis TaxID=182141 RepID=UPI0024BBF24F|nr:FtsX-like permease family protein [Pseudoalteromonas prydzensis]
MIKDTSGQDISVTPKRNYKKPVILVVLTLAIIALCAQAFMGSNPGSISVDRASLQIATVNLSRLVRDVAASGRIVAANAPKVYSPERGYVDLQVKAGDEVSKGDIIALVDSPELNNELKQQQSVLARLDGELQRKHLEARRQKLSLTKTLDLAQVELNAADRENRRAKLSIEKNLISQIDLEKAVDDLARAKLSYKHAQQEVELAKDTLAFELKAAERDLARQQLIVDDLNRQVRNLTIKASVTGIVTVVTQALLDELFPEGDGLGKTIYFGDLPLTIIGVAAHMKSPWLKDSHPNNVALIPYIQGKTYAQFAVRTKPSQRAAVMKQIETAMLNNYSKRVINNIKGLDQLKDEYVAADKLMMRMLIVLITILVLVTALGIFGLTLFNISKRTKQIGTRRALGARKSAIINYFLVENAMICSVGLILGGIAALLLGQLLMQHFSIAALPPSYIAGTAIMVFVMSLLAVFGPARRAANISPSIATRTI